MSIRVATVILVAGGLTIFGLTGTTESARQVVQAKIDILSRFTPSGWMGDGEYGRKYIEFTEADRSAPHSPPMSLRIAYTFGPNRWAGICWQNQPDNWGDKPSDNLSGKGFSTISFWARGATGEETVEFKAGGTDNPKKKFKDSFAVTAGRLQLTKEWKQYQIALKGADLSSVISGFCWVASSDYNLGRQVTFYVDDISWQ